MVLSRVCCESEIVAALAPGNGGDGVAAVAPNNGLLRGLREALLSLAAAILLHTGACCPPRPAPRPNLIRGASQPTTDLGSGRVPREGHEASEAASVLAAREVHGACEAAATSEANAASFLPLHIGSCRRQYSVRRAVPPARLAPHAH